MTELTNEEIHQQVEGLSNAHRLFAQPLLRALHNNGGRASKKKITDEMERLLAGQIAHGDWTELRERGRLGFTRMALRDLGLLSPSEERGVWSLTPTGLRYAAARSKDPIVLGKFEIVPRPEEDATPAPATESVVAHPERYYYVPILEALVAGNSQRGALLDVVFKRVEKYITPGDLRLHSSGGEVRDGRANWAVSNLKAKGHIEAAGPGHWRITDAGRAFLEAQRAGWEAAQAEPPTSRANVLALGVAPPATPKPDTTTSPLEALKSLREVIGEKLIDAVIERVSPDVRAPSSSQPVKRNLILYGPPGTGKTHVARALATALTGDRDGGDDDRFRLVQFHPSYSYEDFIQGLRPDISVSAHLRYTREEGPFLRIARAAEEDPDSFYVLVIDEINRGDPARIFGELLFALEYRNEQVTLPQGGTLTVPPNLVIIGTMNSVDRSVALVDYALRRRFSFLRIDPNPEVIERVHGATLLGRAGPQVLQEFNDWLTQQRDRDHALGHSYFLSVSSPNRDDVFDRIWDLEVRPLLEEYFFGDRDMLEKGAAAWRAIVADALEEARSQ